MIRGTITSIFGDDINTDDIIPALFLQRSTDRFFFKDYAFDKYDPDFRERCKHSSANVVVAGKNFGCGSSREQAVYAIKDNNVAGVIAQSFPDIFYRNSLSNGLVLITIPDISPFHMGDEVQIDLDAGTITNTTTDEITAFEMNPDDKATFQQGGMIGRVRQHLDQILQA